MRSFHPMKKNRILKTFFVSFIIATLIPVLALSCVYFVTLDTIAEEVILSNRSLLEQCQLAAESVFSLAQNVTESLSFDAATSKFIYRTYAYESSELAACIKDLNNSVSISSYILEQANILELGVYSTANQAVVSTMSGYARAGTYFGTSVCFADAGIMESINHAARSEFHAMTNAEIYDKQYQAIVLTSPVFFSNYKTTSGSVYAILDASVLANILGQISLSDDCFAYIADADGKILLCTPGADGVRYANESEINVNSDNYIVFSTKGADKRVYKAYIASDIIYEKVAYIRNMMIAITIIGLSAGIAASFILALRSSKPMMDIYHLVNSGDASTLATHAPITYDYLKGTIKDFIASNTTLNERMTQYMSYSRRDFIRRLVDCSIFLPNEIENRANALGIDLKADVYAALLVRSPSAMLGYDAIADSGDMNNAWMLVEKAFSESGEFSALFSGNSTSEMSILLLLHNSDVDECRHRLTEGIVHIDQTLRARFNLPLIYVCGGFARDIADISGLFIRAQDTAVDCAAEGKVVFADATGKDVLVFYSLHEEMQLAKAISAGETDIARTIASRIVARNTDPATTTPESQRLFRYALYLTVSRMAEGTSAKDDMMSLAAFLIDDHVQSAALADSVLSMIDSLIALTLTHSQSEEKQRLNQILTFIEANIANPNFELYNVAVEFGLPEASLYRYIRAESGHTFSTLLEHYRMRNAEALLITGDRSIDEVARMCGYNSAHTFRRVFKKNYGMLPTQYRDSARNSADRST